MKDSDLALYILNVMNKNNWRQSNQWTLCETKFNGFVSHTDTLYTFMGRTLPLLRTWMDNPQLAYQHLSEESQMGSALSNIVAAAFIEDGGPHEQTP